MAVSLAHPELPLAVTMGDPAGIGPDVTLAAWARRRDCALAPFFVIADPTHFEARAALLGIAVRVARIARPEDAAPVFGDALPVLPLRAPLAPVAPGKPSVAHAAAVIESIEEAVALALSGRAAAVVTAPIAKFVLMETGFAHAGHTEFLAELAVRHGHPPRPPVMLMASPRLKTVPVTVHIPLKDVFAALTPDIIIGTARTTAEGLTRFFGIARPRLAICGLNPHAGENGALGHEETDIIAPSIERLKAESIDATGPHPADTLFHDAARETYDAVLAMYHDQALIPFKTLAFDDGVNVTLGLPFIRTSPDHGTAFALAGTGQANPQSFIEALRLARRMAASAAAGTGPRT
ncbi:4-hydroxythreonine-4-phosphate dehydrogenase PdxA [Rhodomicrobium vannielii ATCC 17100]|uniref:4-hydroxythreonine-4-phosphate dehydrogenase PdxA n=1 Tax=Rhodomicrobium vannielii TaxID=1069 RepID=UPI00191AF457|nr:4-hydroxythreonine-4-phosphate dehydrogenase PdxA [Rhodomicrobium vannielii]MBJ7535326.1 4-hydroxythreonine-4-phosphate dehydrogenase PdxA [Rhodomicrobium vannielii ATCC 17100]